MPDISYFDMDYKESLDFLYNSLPMFQRIGGAAYKAGLDTSIALAARFGNPHESYRTIHVAGTNGKGSTSHLLASILQRAGYRVGLYTSPHLVDFRERIRVDGEMISREAVTDFVRRYRDMHYDGSPSFFELTMVMAFEYFKQMKVDIAVIEVGLGGRLDSTNIISPMLSVITNISFDHMQFLGNTLPQIASEKAGIIKPHTPVVIGEDAPEIHDVFVGKAASVGAPIIFAEQRPQVLAGRRENDRWLLETRDFGTVVDELSGDCQLKNANTVLVSVGELRRLGLTIPDCAVVDGFAGVCEISGLMGRWMVVGDRPRTVCDTGHNTGGWAYLSRQLRNEHYRRLHIVIGFVNDKDITHLLDMLPRNATYYFTRASVPRALDCNLLADRAREAGLQGRAYPTVAEAVAAARASATPDDMIFIGGSTFIVADFLSLPGREVS